MINNLYALALKENDYPSQSMLQWFINEQVEEEKNAAMIVEQIKLADATPVIVHTHAEVGFTVHAEPILAAMTARTRGIIINSPGNVINTPGNVFNSPATTRPRCS